MRVKAVTLALALMTSLAPLAEPADKTVWRVGVVDGSSGEFAGGEPTIFFQKHGASNDERVDVFVRYGQRPRYGRIELAIASHALSEPLHADQEFGEERIPFEVPDFAPDTQDKLTVVVKGHTAHVQETLQPQKKWTLFLVPHVHLDVGYTELSP